jgi:hypothetical protein
MIVTIHQPEHLVWLGLIDKISQADTFVIFDSVQYKKNYFENRNKIRTGGGWTWVTVPVKKHPLDTRIMDIEISYDVDWVARYLGLIQANYRSAPFFNTYYHRLENIITKRHRMLADLNIELLVWFLNCFGVAGKNIVRSSTLHIDPAIKGSDLCVEVCKKMGATRYISGPLGKEYLQSKDFEQAGIELVFHEFHHPTYNQFQGDFLPYMSAIDALFNHGPEARTVLFHCGN